ncbi:hypothetical protein SSP531S_57130 [Streptomyces spongiicola]|uniref:Uncharacterized protein n=2 Tax=Streptomyces spongiicola TaxID=1690221 RepID=A0A388T7G2_9ACTN|nr:hypothetical protein SSP531S_57130 [Streptomyces spongiicola]
MNHRCEEVASVVQAIAEDGAGAPLRGFNGAPQVEEAVAYLGCKLDFVEVRDVRRVTVGRPLAELDLDPSAGVGR